MCTFHWIEHAVIHRVFIILLLSIAIASLICAQLVSLMPLHLSLQIQLLQTLYCEFTNVFENLWPKEELEPTH